MEEEMKKEMPSPYSDFDYDLFREETSNQAIKKILKLFGDNPELLVFSGKATTEKINDSIEEMTGKVIQILVECNVPRADHQYVFESLQTVSILIADCLSKQEKGHQKEIFSRIMGVRNPGDQKFDDRYANYGDLLATLQRVRESTGNNGEDYFFASKPLKDNKGK